MIITKFETYKMRRELKRSGKKFEFKRYKSNKFGEPIIDNDMITAVHTCSGLYHESNGYISVATGETTQTRTKKSPMILCLYEDATLLKIGDIVKINSKTCKVTGVINIQEWNIIADISLEVVDDGF